MYNSGLGHTAEGELASVRRGRNVLGYLAVARAHSVGRLEVVRGGGLGACGRAVVVVADQSPDAAQAGQQLGVRSSRCAGICKLTFQLP